MDLFEAIKGRRSYRSFSSRKVDNEKIDKILDAGNWAPSPANSQPWEFIVITSANARERLFKFSNKAMENESVEIHGFSYVRPVPYEDEGDEQKAGLARYPIKFLKKVPVIIAVVGLPQTGIRQKIQEKAHDGYKYACAAAIQNMLLAAQAQELASLWFTMFDSSVVSQYLNLDNSKHLIAFVCIGYPDDHKPDSPGRVSFKNKVRRID